jgi:hypothetical protein
MSNIEPGHVRVFQAIRSQLYDNITLSSCRINGKPGVAIVMIDQVGEGKVGVMPLFVAINEGMIVEFEGENGPDSPMDEIFTRRAQTKKAAGGAE